MSTLVDTLKAARFEAGFIVVEMLSGVEIRFPVAENRRLCGGTPEQLNRIEVSPFGLHWPDLDEDLSLRGLAEGDYGQHADPKAQQDVGGKPPPAATRDGGR